MGLEPEKSKSTGWHLLCSGEGLELHGDIAEVSHGETEQAGQREQAFILKFFCHGHGAIGP
jgi:hypothetical protein